MSTNYYARNADTEIHIGQFAGGWAFALHVEDSDPAVPSSWEGWIDLLSEPQWSIVDEYEAPLSLATLREIVETPTWRSLPRRRRPRAEWGGDGFDLLRGEFC